MKKITIIFSFAITFSIFLSSLFAGEIPKNLLSNKVSEREEALGRLYELSPGSKKKLIEKIDAAIQEKEPLNHAYLYEALGRLGPEAIPVLSKGAKDPDYKVRSIISEELGRKGPQASSAVPDLVSLLQDPSFTVRTYAIRALGKIAIPSDPIETALLPLLQDPDEGIRAETVDAFGMLGPSVKKGIPPLERLLKKDKWGIQWKAAKALGDIGPEAKSTVPTLIKSLYSDKNIVQNQARISLVKMGPAAVPALRKELKTRHDRVREDVKRALTEVGTPQAKKALERMKK